MADEYTPMGEASERDASRPPLTPKVRCPTCRKFVHPDGMPAHNHAKHPEKTDHA